jgi:hypothetical protein
VEGPAGSAPLRGDPQGDSVRPLHPEHFGMLRDGSQRPAEGQTGDSLRKLDLLGDREPVAPSLHHHRSSHQRRQVRRARQRLRGCGRGAQRVGALGRRQLRSHLRT